MTVAPAVETVEPSSSGLDTDYFSFESAQLTPDVLANLTSYNLTNVTLFDFGTSESAKRSDKGRSAKCKLLPGDSAWPNSFEWRLLDILTGGALIKGVPSASVCYPDWPNYNAAACETVTSEWTTPQYQ